MGFDRASRARPKLERNPSKRPLSCAQPRGVGKREKEREKEKRLPRPGPFRAGKRRTKMFTIEKFVLENGFVSGLLRADSIKQRICRNFSLSEQKKTYESTRNSTALAQC